VKTIKGSEIPPVHGRITGKLGKLSSIVGTIEGKKRGERDPSKG